MRIIAKRALREFWDLHPRAEQPLKAWYALVKDVVWNDPSDVRKMFNSADFVAGNRIIFNIGGNNYRLIVKASYRWQILYIRFVGTHAEYDKIDAATV